MTINDEVRQIYDAATCIPEPYSDLTDEEKHVARYLLDRFDEISLEFGILPLHELLRPMLLSKNGKHAEAVAFSEKQFEETPSWMSAIALANAARRAGDIEYSLRMFTQSALYDSDDVTCWLEVGDMRLERQEFPEALEAYEMALSIDAMHQWALPSAFFCRYQMGFDGKWLSSLREFANQEGCTCGLEGCLTELLGRYGTEDGIARAEYLLDKVNVAPE
jgi:tetratricopeptide (TPR) repeat protein